MLFVTLIIVAVLLFAYVLMETEHVNRINRVAIAMFSGVIVWVLYMLRAGDFIHLVHPDEYKSFLAGAASTTSSVKEFVANNILAQYITEACSVILFLIATNTILEMMHNNGVFDALTRWLRMRNSRRFLWILSVLTFVMSANVDNLTTVVLMMGLMGKIVKSNHQRIIYACTILVSALLGGCFTVIGDMTTVVLWTRGVITPTIFSTGMFLPCLASLVTFNLLLSQTLKGRVEVTSIITNYDMDDSYLSNWQKIVFLIIGIGGLWFIPSFHSLTKLPPFLGALCVLSFLWVVEGIFNFKRNGIALFVQRNYLTNTEFIGMRIILYFIGVSLGAGVLKECGALDFCADWLENNIGNVYVYGAILSLLSSVADNIPVVLMAMNMFPMETVDSASAFAQDGMYWQMLSFCCAMGGSLFFVGTLAGQAVLQIENIPFSWYVRNYAWRVIVAWGVGLLVFWFTH